MVAAVGAVVGDDDHLEWHSCGCEYCFPLWDRLGNESRSIVDRDSDGDGWGGAVHGYFLTDVADIGDPGDPLDPVNPVNPVDATDATDVGDTADAADTADVTVLDPSAVAGD